MLARTLGRTVSELGESMSLDEFAQHWNDYQRSPWGDRRADIHAAQIAQTIANYAGMTRKEPAKLAEFLIEFDRDDAPEEAEPDPAAFFGHFMK